MTKSSTQKKLVPLLTIPFLGAFFLLITFLAYAFLQSMISRFSPYEIIPHIRLAVFLLIVVGVTIIVFRSQLSELIKATFTVVPLATMLVTMGIILFQWQIVSFIVCIIIFGVHIFCLYLMKVNWYYYYAAVLIALTLLIMTATGVQI